MGWKFFYQGSDMQNQSHWKSYCKGCVNHLKKLLQDAGTFDEADWQRGTQGVSFVKDLACEQAGAIRGDRGPWTTHILGGIGGRGNTAPCPHTSAEAKKGSTSKTSPLARWAAAAEFGPSSMVSRALPSADKGTTEWQRDLKRRTEDGRCILRPVLFGQQAGCHQQNLIRPVASCFADGGLPPTDAWLSIGTPEGGVAPLSKPRRPEAASTPFAARTVGDAWHIGTPSVT
ncbi:hypothetical protein B0H13DRAFT_1853607 [Mycena leptocephala]|nr:hypothetical protein B0H13DRAFT_1853607 [Mycena leptocephala]